jgi:hypothetical protein
MNVFPDDIQSYANATETIGTEVRSPIVSQKPETEMVLPVSATIKQLSPNEHVSA